MEILKNINFIIGLLFVVCYCYQYIYILIGFFAKPKTFSTSKPNRFALMISARNEEKVIAHLIESLNEQDYPRDMFDIYVVADNCTDSTASEARAAGAAVWERFNKEEVGKGYALNFLMHKIFDLKGRDYYDGYMVFDADNLVDRSFVSEINKTFSNGYKVVTSHRNSKNYGDNWISAGYALWFLREAIHLNNVRMILGSSCAVAGTGFVFSRDIALRNDGWPFHLLSEDIEFSINTILHGEKIGYCHTAVIYDEQPVVFKTSWHQRIRWTKGYIQVFRKYGLKLLRGLFSKMAFSCFDMIMTIMPSIFFSLTFLVLNIAAPLVACFFAPESINELLLSAAQTLGLTYLLLFAVGAAAAICDRKQLLCSKGRIIRSLFTFPLFMFTYMPICLCVFFSKAQWKPIEHHVAASIGEIK